MNSTVIHERPGVYSSYDASTAIHGGGAKKGIGVVAKAASGEKNVAVQLTNYAAGLALFGEDSDATAMAALLKMVYRNGASSVVAVAVPDSGTTEAYAAAFAQLQQWDNVSVVLCDSDALEVQQALRDSVVEASAMRRERIAVVGCAAENTTDLIARAKELNSERVVLVGGIGLAENGAAVGGPATAAAAAAVIAAGTDPAVPLNGAELKGLAGVNTTYSDDEIDLLVRGGVTPLETVAGSVCVVRGITTRTTTGGAADNTWRELTTILIVDDVIPQIRNALRGRFTRTKNTAQTRSAIRSQVIVELEQKKSAEIIDSFGEVQVRAAEEDPSVCEVEFSFAVAHGLNQIYLTAHITV